MGAFEKTDAEELVGKALGKVQDGIKDGMEKQVKKIIKKKLIETLGKVTKEQLEKAVKEETEKYMRNMFTIPSLIVEFTAKYYNVADFFAMFEENAENERVLLYEIRRVLTALRKLNDKEIHKCYHDQDYFRSLREALKEKQRPLLEMLAQKPAKKAPKGEPVVPTKIKSKVKKKIVMAEAAFAVREERRAVIEALEKTDAVTVPSLNTKPFYEAIRMTQEGLRADQYDFKSFGDHLKSIRRDFEGAVAAWLRAAGRATEKRIAQQTKDPDEFERIKKRELARLKEAAEVHRRNMAFVVDRTIAAADKEMKALHAEIKALCTSVDLRGEYKALDTHIEARCLKFLRELNERNALLKNVSRFDPHGYPQLKRRPTAGTLVGSFSKGQTGFTFTTLADPDAFKPRLTLAVGSWFAKELTAIYRKYKALYEQFNRK
jgi:hypothetical protein